VKALYLALRLWMSDAAPMQPYALFHPPQSFTAKPEGQP
jgi:hypothetical protein